MSNHEYNGMFNVDEIFAKAFLPYHAYKNLDMLKSTALPSKNEFYDELREEHIESDDYKKVEKVWEKLSRWEVENVRNNPLKWIPDFDKI